MVKAQDLYALSEPNRLTPAIAYRLNHNHIKSMTMAVGSRRLQLNTVTDLQLFTKCEDLWLV